MGRLAGVAVVLGGLLACQGPFETDRHDLVGDRVVALTVHPDADGLRVRTALLVDGRPWSDEPVALRWHRIASPEDAFALDPGAPGVADGPVLLVDEPDAVDRPALALVATFPSGAVRRAVLPDLRVAADPLPVPAGLTLGVLDGLDLEATPEELALEARRDREATPAEAAPAGAFARLRPDWPGDVAPPALTTTRWMGTAGTFLELDRTTTDWIAADVTYDELEVDDPDAAVPLEDGPVTVLALFLDDAAGQRLHDAEVWVGPPGPGVRTFDRWLPTDADPPDTRWLAGTLVSDDAAPSGLRLVDLAPTRPAGADPYGTGALPCVDVAGPFDPGWLLDGRCLRADLDGARVVVETR